MTPKEQKSYAGTMGMVWSAEIISNLEKEIADNDRWMREVLTDFRIPFDDHKVGRRLAFTQWMFERQQQEWTPQPPTLQGEYWHWNGDCDSSPVPMFVLWSETSRKCFVSAGQLGIATAIDCDKYGGWWMRLYVPATPT